jgi:hypothetical protein
MAEPYLVPCLVTLRGEFNALNENRDKSSDGWIGDQSHQSGQSDHNPASDGGVHAIDVDKSGPWPEGSMEKFVQYIISECRKSGETGKDRGRLKYVIYDRRIWSASNGWAEEYYSGSNAHDQHAHFSCEYDSKYENDTTPWGLEDKFGGGFMAFIENQDQFNAAMDKWVAKIVGGGVSAGPATSKKFLSNSGDIVPRFVDGSQVPSTDGNPTTGVEYALGQTTGATQRLEKEVDAIKDILGDHTAKLSTLINRP